MAGTWVMEQQQLDPFFAQPAPLNHRYNWGPGQRLGNGQNNFRLNLGAGAGPMRVPLRGVGFAPEEYAQMGIEPPGYLGALQRAGIVRNGRPGPFAAINAAQAQRQAQHGPFRQGFRLGARGLAAMGHPIGYAGMVADYAWGENEGEGGPAQLRQIGNPRQHRGPNYNEGGPAEARRERIRFRNNVNRREFRHNEPAAAVANATRNNKVKLNNKEGPRVKVVKPIPQGNARRNAEWQAPNPNRANIANMAYVPRQANAARLAAELHNELEPPAAALPEAAPPAHPRNGTAASLLSPPPAPQGPGILGRVMGALGLGAAAISSGAPPSAPAAFPTPNRPSLRGGKTRRAKKNRSRARSYRK